MLIIFGDKGPKQTDNRPCFTWEGLPSLREILECLSYSDITGLRVVVHRTDLPPERIGTYQLGTSTHGSYDGNVLLVSACCPEADGTREYEAYLQNTYGRIKRLLVKIAKGDAERTDGE